MVTPACRGVTLMTELTYTVGPLQSESFSRAWHIEIFSLQQTHDMAGVRVRMLYTDYGK